ncbi:MAG: hypothetical protein KKI08_13745 [Armatimonadetes bacterium]|nr:hypothetical protein [Armatimonadota bacterium]
MRRLSAEARAAERPDTGLPAFWVTVYLVAVLIVGVAVGTLLGRYNVGGAGELWRLLPMLLVGELIVYLAILVVPGERIVPPGRALFGVAFGMAIRVLMAFLTAAAMRLSDPSAGQGALMARAYATQWLLALVQLLLVLFYLWLIRGALETDRLRPPVRRARRRLVEQERRDVEQAEARRQRLLSALHESSQGGEAPPAAPSGPPSVPQPQPSPEPAAEAVPAVENDPVPEAVPAPEPEAQPQPEPEPEPEPVAEAVPAREAEPEPEAEPELEPAPELQPEPSPDPEPAVDSVTEAEPQVQPEPAPEPMVEAEAEPEPADAPQGEPDTGDATDAFTPVMLAEAAQLSLDLAAPGPDATDSEPDTEADR